MSVQRVSPHTTQLRDSADLYLMVDHMPLVNLDNCGDQSLEEIKSEFFGKNSFETLLSTSNINKADKFFVFDGYVYLEGFSDTDHSVFLPEQSAFCNKSNVYLGNIDFSKKVINFNCPMHNSRYNRIIASCWLYNHAQHLKFDYTQSWESDQKESLLFELLKLGDLATWQGSQYQLKNLNKKYIESNFVAIDLYYNNQQYRDMLINSAVSVVLSVTFWEQGCFLDEKYLTAIYSGTIPLCDGYKFYDIIKKLGFDVFDDIIDTSHQHETNPILRTWTMLEKNQQVLENALDLVQRPDIQQRLLNNYELAKDPHKLFRTAFKNLNTESAQQRYLQKYQAIIRQATQSAFKNPWTLIESEL
jgi:hypothetical protein